MAALGPVVALLIPLAMLVGTTWFVSSLGTSLVAVRAGRTSKRADAAPSVAEAAVPRRGGA